MTVKVLTRSRRIPLTLKKLGTIQKVGLSRPKKSGLAWGHYAFFSQDIQYLHFQDQKVGRGNILDKVTSAKSHGEEQRTEVYRTIRKLLCDYVERLYLYRESG